MNRAFIGCSGYSYDHWIGIFYPNTLEDNELFEYYVRFFDTVEINSSYYNMPWPNVLKSWFNKSPSSFRFTIKAPQRILNYNEPPDHVIQFFQDRLDILEDKVSCVLWQFSRMRKFTPEFSKFIKSVTRIRARHAFEFRHESFQDRSLCSMLVDHNCCLVDPSTPPQEGLPQFHVRTADFYYFRMHGNRRMCASSYNDEELTSLSSQVNNRISHGQDVYVYFNNDAEAYAVRNALKLKVIIHDERPRQS